MSIYQHFRQEERIFIDQVLDMRDRVERNYVTVFTHFLDPRSAHIFKSVIGSDERFSVTKLFEHVESERTMYALSPYYEKLTDSDFPVAVLKTTYPAKFVEIKHPDVLGTFLSLGISLEQLGDLVVDKEKGIITMLVSQSVATFVVNTMTRVKKATTAFSLVNLSDYQPSEKNWSQSETTVASLRLDALIKEMYLLSRSEAKKMIESGLVKVNFKQIDVPSFILTTNDLISVRKKGRARLTKINGQTKKDKWRISFERLL